MQSVVRGSGSCILSPHSDDAALSLSVAIQTGALPQPVTVVTVYSTSSFSRSRIGSTPATTRMRLEEDRRFADAFNVGLIPLGFLDAPLRYGSDDVFNMSAKPSAAEINDQTKAIMRTWESLGEPVLVVPTGLGGHVDHRIVAGVDVRSASRVLRYADQPYAFANPESFKSDEPPTWSALASKKNVATKLRATDCYPSQPAAERMSALLEASPAESIVEALWLVK